VGLDAVLREVGVSKQTFYNHFESRDDLILQVLRHRDSFEMGVWRERLVEVAGEDPAARLHALFDVLDIYFQDPEFRGCIFINAAAEFVSTADPAHQIAAGNVLALQHFIETLAQAAGAPAPGDLAEQLTILIRAPLFFATYRATPSPLMSPVRRQNFCSTHACRISPLSRSRLCRRPPTERSDFAAVRARESTAGRYLNPVPDPAAQSCNHTADE
jgi:AcrR family transcriptional regulator